MDCKSENGGKKKTAPMTPPVANRTKKNCTRAVGSIQKKLGEYDAHFLSSLVEREAMRRCKKSDHQSRKVLPSHSCQHASRTYTAGGDISSLYPSTGGLQTPAASAIFPLSPPTSGSRIRSVQSNLAQLVEVEDRIRKLQQAREVQSVQQELQRIILFKQEQVREQQRRQELLGILLRQSQSEMIQTRNSKRISSSTVAKKFL